MQSACQAIQYAYIVIYTKMLYWDVDTGRPTKNETIETTVRNLFCPFCYIPESLQAKTGIFLCLITY